MFATNIFLKIFYVLERTSMSGGGGGEQRDSEAVSKHYQHEAPSPCGAWSHEPQDCDLSWNQESTA